MDCELGICRARGRLIGHCMDEANAPAGRRLQRRRISLSAPLVPSTSALRRRGPRRWSAPKTASTTSPAAQEIDRLLQSPIDLPSEGNCFVRAARPTADRAAEIYKLPKGYNEAYRVAGEGILVPVVCHLADKLLQPILTANYAKVEPLQAALYSLRAPARAKRAD